MFVILEYYPYNKADGVVRVLGPFANVNEAERMRDSILVANGHPDSDWEIKPVENANARLAQIQADEDSA